MTDLQRQIKKELKRISKQTAELKERGYTIKAKYNYRPKDASRRTLERLKKINKTSLKEHRQTTYHGAASNGKLVTGKEGAKLERSEAAKKRERTKKQKRERERIPAVNIINEIRDILSMIPDYISYQYNGVWIQARQTTPDKNILNNLLDIAAENLTHDTVNYFSSVKGAIQNEVAKTQESKGETVEHALARLAEIIKGAPLSQSEQLSLGEMVDGLEVWES